MRILHGRYGKIIEKCISMAVAMYINFIVNIPAMEIGITK